MVIALIVVFVLGYMAIALESQIKINKTASALITGVLTWVIYIMNSNDPTKVNNELIEHLGDTSSILFFLMGAMTIVELIDANNGFDIILKFITQTNKRKLLWYIGLLTFFLSSILDNLTTTIVIVSILNKLLKKKEDRWLFAGIVVIAANAGGAWTPIGDVTTTMLWIGGQISAGNIMIKLLIPSLISLIIPLMAISLTLKGDINKPAVKPHKQIGYEVSKRDKTIILVLGLLMLLSVPVFKSYTQLPPFMGMLLGVSILWIYTEIRHKKDDPEKTAHLTLIHALHMIDLSSILFFMGILTAVAALSTAGILADLEKWLSSVTSSLSAIIMSIGMISSVVDNVPLVAAVQGMYPLAQYPMNHFIWEFLAYCAGTGGSILIIGSAAGVAAMGMEKIDFFWYVKRITWLALLGYFGGAFSYLLIEHLFF